jgi:hypothetical protein
VKSTGTPRPPSRHRLLLANIGGPLTIAGGGVEIGRTEKPNPVFRHRSNCKLHLRTAILGRENQILNAAEEISIARVTTEEGDRSLVLSFTKSLIGCKTEIMLRWHQIDWHFFALAQYCGQGGLGGGMVLLCCEFEKSDGFGEISGNTAAIPAADSILELSFRMPILSSECEVKRG